MAEKKNIRRTVKVVEKIKTWQLVIMLIMAGFVAATFLRLNNIGMIERRDAVIVADELGDPVQLQKRLYDLQRYVSSHMNADPGRIALEHSYQRDNDRRKEEFTNRSSNNPNGNVYAQVAAVCDPIGQAQGWRWPDVRYTNCINEELAKYPSSDQLEPFTPLAPDPYYHTFISPRWSPDYAGWSLVVCAVISLVIVFRLIVLGILRLLLRSKYRRL